MAAGHVSENALYSHASYSSISFSADQQCLIQSTHSEQRPPNLNRLAFNFGDGHLFKYYENSHLLNGLLR